MQENLGSDMDAFWLKFENFVEKKISGPVSRGLARELVFDYLDFAFQWLQDYDDEYGARNAFKHAKGEAADMGFQSP